MLKSLSKDTLIYGGGDLLGKLIAFVTFPIIATALSPKVFGELELINTGVALLVLISNCGLNNSVQRFYWDSEFGEKRQHSIISTALILIFLFSVVLTCLTGFIFEVNLFNYESYGFSVSKKTIYLALSIVCLSQLLNFVQDITRLQFSPLKFFGLSLTGKGLTAISSMIFVVWLQQGIEGYLFSGALVLLITLFVGTFLIKGFWHFKFNYDIAKTLIKFGYPFIYAGLGSILLSVADRWMLAKYSSVEEVGVYSIAFRYASLVSLFSYAFGQAWSPYAIKMKSDHPEDYRSMYSRVLLFLFAIMSLLAIACSLFAGEIVAITLSQEYYGAAPIFIILCFSIVFQATTQITAVGISLERKTHLFAKITWLSVFVNIILNFYFIQKYGALGAAFTTLFSSVLVTSSYCFCTQKLHPIPFEWKRLFWLALITLFLGLFSFLTLNYSYDLIYILTKVFVFVVVGVFIAFLSSIKLSNLKEFFSKGWAV